MLTCKEFLAELNDFLDEKTKSEIRAKLERHLAECPELLGGLRYHPEDDSGLQGHVVVHDSGRRAFPADGGGGT